MSSKSKWTKRALYLLLATGAILSISASLKTDPIPVQVARAVRGPLVVTVDGTGRTKLLNKQTLSAPAIGELTKISLRAGDKVHAGQVLAEIEPSIPMPIDARTNAEIIARLGSAQASLVEARRNVERAEIALDLADKEAQRNRQLVAASALAPHALELSETELKARRSELELAKATVERIRRESNVVAAPLSDPNKSTRKTRQRVEVRAPSDGVILRVHQESAGPVTPGTPLLDLGDLGTLELIVDLPTQSAVRVRAGALVRVDGIGNGVQLAGKVKLVEPAAFTKVTALGVEEQRVNVVVTPVDRLSEWASLGDGFAADAHIEVHKAESVLKVPLGAVFRDGNHSAVFRLENAHARLTQVETGNRSAEEVEIKGGLTETSSVVVHPSDKLTNGALVKPE